MVRGADRLTAVLQERYEAKARAEIAAAASEAGVDPGSLLEGDPLAAVAVLRGGGAHAAEVEDAARKALEALGIDAAGVCFLTVPGRGRAAAALARAVVEAVDPAAVFAVDDDASDVLAAAFEAGRLVRGRAVVASGRVLGSVGDLGASLADPRAKRAVWAAFRSIAAHVPASLRRPGTKGPGPS